MIEGLKPYPVYRASGLPWLDQIPEHWRVRRNGTLFTQRNETGFGELPILEVSLRTGVRVRDMDSGRKQIMSDREKYKRAARGDLAYNMMRMWQGALGVVPLDGLVSPAYVVAQPLPDADPTFYCELFRTPEYLREVDKYSRGIVADRNRLYWEGFKQIPSPWPSPDEQRAIVRFLHYADRRIRKYIAAKRKLLVLLEEQKRAIVHRAVTKGLDQRMPLRESGIEWLGQIPAHWNIRRLKDETQFQNGFAFKPTDWKPEGMPIIRIQNLNGSEEFNFSDREDIPARFVVAPGDLLFAWSGNVGTSFGSFIWDRPFKGYLNQHIFKLHGYSMNRMFFAYLLRGVTAHVEEQSHGIIGLVHVSKPELGAIRIPVPPEPEQREIADWIGQHTRRISDAVDHARRELSLLHEYRNRLTSDVVTGKFDVREAAARLPDEPGEALAAEDPLDDAEADETDEADEAETAA
ncbi:MAG: restriction endonuclease subunit S [Polyangiales bacterium]